MFCHMPRATALFIDLILSSSWLLMRLRLAQVATAPGHLLAKRKDLSYVPFICTFHMCLIGHSSRTNE